MENIVKERDELKRRAEAAEAALTLRQNGAASMPDDRSSWARMYELLREQDRIDNESGPGISATDLVRKHFRGDGHWVLDEDLLCGDER
jgi:hypothetical protein